MRTIIALLAVLGAVLAPPGSALASQPPSRPEIGLGTGDWSDSPLWLGRFGSQANDLAVRGRTAYVLTDITLEVWDVDPIDGSARRLGTTGDLDVSVGWPTALSVENGLACVAYGPDGLRVVDVSDPTAPAVIGALTLTDNAHDIDLTGSLACVATTAGVHLVDVSRPDVPRAVAYLPTGAPPRLDLVGNLLFVADPAVGLIVTDVSTPSRPVTLGTLSLTAGTGHVTALDGQAFIARPGAVDMIDVRDPRNPRLVRSALLGRGPGKVTIRGARLYVPDFATGEIRIWSWRRGRLLANTYVAHVPGRVEVTDADQLVVAGRTGFDVIRMDEPRNEGPLARVSFPSPTRRVAAAEEVVVAAGTWSRALSVLDVRDPRRPVQLPVSVPVYVNDVLIRSSVAYIAGGRNTGQPERDLLTLDISRPESPQLLSFAPVTWSDGFVSLSNGFAAVSGGGGPTPTVSFVDAKDPAALAPIGTYRTLGIPRRVWIEPGPGNGPGIAFAALPSFGFEVVDLAGGRPRYLSATPLPHGASDIQVRDGVALIAGDDFYALDVSDPLAPVLLATIPTPGDAVVLAIDRNLAYVADQSPSTTSGGIVAIDISNPRTPFAIGAVPTGGNAYYVAVADDLVWVADGIAGVRVIGGHPQPPSAAELAPRASLPSDGAPRLALVGPNPLRGGATAFDVANPLDQAVSVVVHDVTGRRVRTLLSGPMPAGHRQLTWDGRDAAGRLVGAGVYFVALRAGDATSARKIVVSAMR